MRTKIVNGKMYELETVYTINRSVLNRTYLKSSQPVNQKLYVKLVSLLDHEAMVQDESGLIQRVPYDQLSDLTALDGIVLKGKVNLNRIKSLFAA